jgi:hypothetical protein
LEHQGRLRWVWVDMLCPDSLLVRALLG